MRKLLRHVQRVPAVLLGHAGGLVKQFQDGLPRLIELIGVVRNGVFGCKGDHRIGLGSQRYPSARSFSRLHLCTLT